MRSLRVRLLTLVPTLLLPFLLSACGASAEKEPTAKIDPPELVLRNFYSALDNDDSEAANALLSQRAKLADPKGGSLLSNTTALIQQNGGIAKFNVLKVGAEIVEVEHSEGGPVEEQRTVTVEFEITFNNGETRRSESQFIYEQLDKLAEAADDAPSEFGWRVEGVRQVWQD